MIFINSALDDAEKKVVCCHELGHAVLHSKTNIVFLEKHTLFTKDQYEYQANKFCVYLLLSGCKLPDYENFSLEQVSAATGIPLSYLRLIF